MQRYLCNDLLSSLNTVAACDGPDGQADRETDRIATSVSRCA